MKKCIKCGIEKELSEFHKDARLLSGYRCDCKDCYKERNNSWRKANRDHANKRQQKYRKSNPERTESYKLFGKYGIRKQDKDKLLEMQEFKCAICGESLFGKVPNMDHDHVTNKVRGILCMNCNLALGLLKDSVEILKLATKYLEKYKAE